MLLLPGFVALITAMMAWALSPQWLPSAARTQLPDGWVLEELRSSRPGIHQTDVFLARLSSQIMGRAVSVRISDARIDHRSFAVHINRLDLTVSDEGPGQAMTFRTPQDLSIPALVMNTSLPLVTIAKLSISGMPGPAAEPLELEDVTLGNEAQALELQAEIRGLPGMQDILQLSLSAGPQQLVASARDPNNTTVVSFEQGTTEDGYQSRVNARLDLAALDWASLNPLLKAAALPELSDPGGVLEMQAVFSGTSQQTLKQASAMANQASVSTTSLGLYANGSIKAQFDGNKGYLGPEKAWDMQLSGPAEQWPEALSSMASQLLTDFGISFQWDTGSKLTAWLEMTDSLALELEFGPDKLSAWRLSGEMEALLSSEASSARLGASDLQFSQSLDDQPGSRASGNLRWTVGNLPPLLMAMGVDSLSVTGLNSEGTAAFQLNNDATVNFTTDTHQSAGSQLVFDLPQSQQVLRASQFSLGGMVSLHGSDWRYDGPVAGRDLELEQSGERVILTRDWALETILLSNSGALSSSGSGHFFDLEVRAAETGIDQAQVQWGPLALEPVSGKLSLQAQGLNLTLPDMSGRIDKINAGLTVRADGTAIGHGSMEPVAGINLPFDFSIDLESGDVQAQVPPSEFPARYLAGLSSAFSLPWPELLSISDGTVEVSSQMAMGDTLDASFSASGKTLGGKLAKTRFSGLNFEASGGQQSSMEFAGTLGIEEIELAADLKVSELTLAFIQSRDIEISRLKANLLGGEITIPQINLVDLEPQPMQLNWQGLDLNRLFRYADIGGLEATGIIDTQLPVHAVDQGLAIVDGQIGAKSPGIIRYQSSSVAPNIGLQALENFHYSELTGRVNYNPEGPYLLALNLLGKNPDLYGGHPIRFRLNLEGDMPALFKSLFLTGSFEDAILESINSSNFDGLP